MNYKNKRISLIAISLNLEFDNRFNQSEFIINNIKNNVKKYSV